MSRGARASGVQGRRPWCAPRLSPLVLFTEHSRQRAPSTRRQPGRTPRQSPLHRPWTAGARDPRDTGHMKDMDVDRRLQRVCRASLIHAPLHNFTVLAGLSPQVLTGFSPKLPFFHPSVSKSLEATVCGRVLDTDLFCRYRGDLYCSNPGCPCSPALKTDFTQQFVFFLKPVTSV